MFKLKNFLLSFLLIIFIIPINTFAIDFFTINETSVRGLGYNFIIHDEANIFSEEERKSIFQQEKMFYDLGYNIVLVTGIVPTNEVNYDDLISEYEEYFSFSLPDTMIIYYQQSDNIIYNSCYLNTGTINGYTNAEFNELIIENFYQGENTNLNYIDTVLSTIQYTQNNIKAEIIEEETHNTESNNNLMVNSSENYKEAIKDNEPYVVVADKINLLSEEEEQQLLNLGQSLSTNRNRLNIIFLTDSVCGNSAEPYFYDYYYSLPLKYENGIVCYVAYGSQDQDFIGFMDQAEKVVSYSQIEFILDDAFEVPADNYYGRLATLANSAVSRYEKNISDNYYSEDGSDKNSYGKNSSNFFLETGLLSLFISLIGTVIYAVCLYLKHNKANKKIMANVYLEDKYNVVQNKKKIINSFTKVQKGYYSNGSGSSSGGSRSHGGGGGSRGGGGGGRSGGRSR